MSFKDETDLLIGSINEIMGVSCVYNYASGDPSSNISGVFDYGFLDVTDVSSKKPVLRNVPLASLTASPVEGDTVTIESVTYKVMDHEPDTYGTTTLILQKT